MHQEKELWKILIIFALAGSLVFFVLFQFVLPAKYSPKNLINQASKGKVYVLPGLGLKYYIPPELEQVSFGATYLNPKEKTFSQDVSMVGQFQTRELLLTKDPCVLSTTNPPLGNLYKITGSYNNSADRKLAKGELIKEFDGFFVTYDTPESACAGKPEIENQANQLKPKIRDALENSLQELTSVEY